MLGVGELIAYKGPAGFRQLHIRIQEEDEIAVSLFCADISRFPWRSPLRQPTDIGLVTQLRQFGW